MNVFLTGASGYVGSRVAARLLAEGHSVVGLARSERTAESLRHAGISPVIGDLSASALIADTASKADAVVHTAFDHAGDWLQAVEADRNAHLAIVEALAGSGKAFVTSNGMGIFGDTGLEIVDETTGVKPSPRVLVERIALDAAARGVRSSSIRLALLVYGHGGSVFVPTLINAARRDGVSWCIGEGSNLMSVVHVDDAAALYILAATSAPAGSCWHAAAGADVSLRRVADAIGRMLNVPTQSVSIERAKELWHPTWAGLLAIANRTVGHKAMRELGWQPRVPLPLLDDIETGSYAVSS